tara:strand:- start:246 stop:626 length:381 start_codon:yes stop_codon:yes gene_type:complete
MRNALFVFCAYVNQQILNQINQLNETLTMLVVHSAHAFFSLIDNDRMDHVRSTVEQKNAISELRVFALISEVVDDAIDVGGWNEDHETKLNFFGNMLYTEHDWDVDEVHRYLTEVIERAAESMQSE